MPVLGAARARGKNPCKRRRAVSPEEQAIRDLAKKKGLKNVRASKTTHYVGIGDAPTPQRESAVKLCEALASTYQKHFTEKGFETTLPKDPMIVVVLANRNSYAAFIGEPVSEDDGGFYDVEANYLVTCDAKAARTNTFTLVHEAMHQLTYATGLLSRAGDVPVAISEGFGTYAETWTLRNPVMGGFNHLRLDALSRAAKSDWIGVERLLANDDVFSKEETRQVAYAEAWLLIHTLLNTREPNLKGKLGVYLTAIHKRADATKRVEDATAAFGDLASLDALLRKTARCS